LRLTLVIHVNPFLNQPIISLNFEKLIHLLDEAGAGRFYCQCSDAGAIISERFTINYEEVSDEDKP
jgi:hypothetical protein